MPNERKMDPEMQARFAAMMERRKEFAPANHPAQAMYDDVMSYPVEELVELLKIGNQVGACEDKEERAKLIAAFVAKRDSIQKKPDAPAHIPLWPEGKIPTLTEYTENADLSNSHDPDFVPYMQALLVPEDVTPKGALVVCAGGHHGDATIHEGYMTCVEFHKLGYQTFLLNNRPNMGPWSKIESGADGARAIRMIRRDAAKYRIDPHNIAWAGFSNGGLTGENCITYFSGEKKMTDYFPDYEPDELDAYYGAPDAFLCVYGPHFAGQPFEDYSGVKFPPTFFAVGRKDTAMDNLHWMYPKLLEHGVPLEVHTFANTPHGQAGVKVYDNGVVKHPNFELWIPLADYFMQDVYHPQD